jgi:site-specific DNA recombinase
MSTSDTKASGTKAPRRRSDKAAYPARRMALYARVSSDEQTRGNYPSCTSQVEELQAACHSKGWEAYRVIKDEGHSAGSLKRPGLAELRWLVETGEIDGIICTWYDRLTRSRDFYILDKEFRAHDVEFITLHDPTDTRTAAGRFMESMLVAAKTYDREQTSEKVRSKMRMRAEKGMWNGGPIPYGFRAVSQDRTIMPDEEQSQIIGQMFRIYMDTGSDFKVRDWLRAHQIPARNGSSDWQVSSIRKILTNRRYVAEIEINRENKGIADLPESEAYCVVKAPYEPMVPVELFELAQAVRQQKSAGSPNRRGRPRSYSQTQCNRVYLLQGILVCGCCTRAMAPYYILHRAGERNGKKRKVDSYVTYYACTRQIKNSRATDHKNRVLARLPESWILDRVRELATSECIIERAMERARANAEIELRPVKEGLALTEAALRENAAQIDRLIATISGGQADGALLELLNEKAAELKGEREKLQSEQRQQKEALAPLAENFDAATFRSILVDFDEFAREAEPEELQRVLRLMVKRIEWGTNGWHRVHFYHLPKSRLPHQSTVRRWFETNGNNGSP